MRRNVSATTFLVLLLVGCGGGGKDDPPPTFWVWTTEDAGPGSLRQAVLDANASPGTNEICFEATLLGQTIALTGGEIVIADSATVTGLGAKELTVTADPDGDGNATSRVFTVDDGADTVMDVFISGITMAGGASDSGGVIRSSEDLTLESCAVSGGHATAGGGVFNSGNLATFNCTIWGNTAESGGGVFTDGDVEFLQCTLSGNSALSTGGGVHVAGGSVTMDHCTVAGNGAAESGGGIYAAVQPEPAPVCLRNTLVAGNSSENPYDADVGPSALAASTVVAVLDGAKPVVEAAVADGAAVMSGSMDSLGADVVAAVSERKQAVDAAAQHLERDQGVVAVEGLRGEANAVLDEAAVWGVPDLSVLRQELTDALASGRDEIPALGIEAVGWDSYFLFNAGCPIPGHISDLRTQVYALLQQMEDDVDAALAVIRADIPSNALTYVQWQVTTVADTATGHAETITFDMFDQVLNTTSGLETLPVPGGLPPDLYMYLRDDVLNIANMAEGIPHGALDQFFAVFDAALADARANVGALGPEVILYLDGEVQAAGGTGLVIDYIDGGGPVPNFPFILDEVAARFQEVIDQVAPLDPPTATEIEAIRDQVLVEIDACRSALVDDVASAPDGLTALYDGLIATADGYLGQVLDHHDTTTCPTLRYELADALSAFGPILSFLAQNVEQDRGFADISIHDQVQVSAASARAAGCPDGLAEFDVLLATSLALIDDMTAGMVFELNTARLDMVEAINVGQFVVDEVLHQCEVWCSSIGAQSYFGRDDARGIVDPILNQVAVDVNAAAVAARVDVEAACADMRAQFDDSVANWRGAAEVAAYSTAWTDVQATIDGLDGAGIVAPVLTDTRALVENRCAYALAGIEAGENVTNLFDNCASEVSNVVGSLPDLLVNRLDQELVPFVGTSMETLCASFDPVFAPAADTFGVQALDSIGPLLDQFQTGMPDAEGDIAARCEVVRSGFLADMVAVAATRQQMRDVFDALAADLSGAVDDGRPVVDAALNDLLAAVHAALDDAASSFSSGTSWRLCLEELVASVPLASETARGSIDGLLVSALHQEAADRVPPAEASVAAMAGAVPNVRASSVDAILAAMQGLLSGVDLAVDGGGDGLAADLQALEDSLVATVERLHEQWAGDLSDDTGLTGEFDLVSTGGEWLGIAGAGEGNLLGTAATPFDAMLGSLGDNGGEVPTMAPLDGSPAVDAGDPAFAGPPYADQRGGPRVSGSGVDIGAVEY